MKKITHMWYNDPVWSNCPISTKVASSHGWSISSVYVEIVLQVSKRNSLKSLNSLTGLKWKNSNHSFTLIGTMKLFLTIPTEGKTVHLSAKAAHTCNMVGLAITNSNESIPVGCVLPTFVVPGGTRVDLWSRGYGPRRGMVPRGTVRGGRH